MPSAEQPRATAWAQARSLVQTRVAEVAVALFLERGFEATTMEQVAAAADVSPRTLFRYFGTKEDLVLGDARAQGQQLAGALAARPASEDPWTALARAASSLPSAALPDRGFAIAQLVVTTPSLQARHAQKHAEWQRLLVPVLRERMGPDAAGSDVRAAAITATALACLDAATQVWVDRSGRGSLAELYAEAVEAVRG